MFQLRINKRNKVFLIIFISFLTVLSVLLAENAMAVYQYDSYGRRDPFVPLVGVASKVGVSGAAGVLTIDGVQLEGIIIGSDGKPEVIINGEILKEGDRIGLLLIESIGPNDVRIKIVDTYYNLKLYE